MKSKVALIKCPDYREDSVDHAVRKGLELLGGVSAFASAGEKIVLKPNILAGDDADKAITTHPAVFKAVARVFKEQGVSLSYGDSPAIGNPDRAAKRTGIKEAGESLDIPLADFLTPVTVSHPDALLAKKLIIAKSLLEADGLISLPKMKTHGFTRITGAVKNQFGCLPGLQKAEFHVKMPDIYDFSKVLVDINTFLKPRLHIMDGIVAMEGNGPRSGEPVPMKVLLFSADPVAVDAVFCRLIDMPPQYVPTMEFGREAGLGTYKQEEIEIVGEAPEELVNRDFDAVRKAPDRFGSTRMFPTFLKNFISPKPVISADRCILCGQCVEICPVKPKAVQFPPTGKKTPPGYAYKRCIRCYCCQEICPEKAITIKTPFAGRLIRR
ncbi:MAG: DUF362 domain-containing protein [bacterium]|nr:DUF362 domain-containing protein [bacterium]